ncbi:hypothetical protein KIPB_003047, partial [Kipferlia bialata]|eukprot:g3047.t1
MSFVRVRRGKDTVFLCTHSTARVGALLSQLTVILGTDTADMRLLFEGKYLSPGSAESFTATSSNSFAKSNGGGRRRRNRWDDDESSSSDLSAVRVRVVDKAVLSQLALDMALVTPKRKDGVFTTDRLYRAFSESVKRGTPFAPNQERLTAFVQEAIAADLEKGSRQLWLACSLLQCDEEKVRYPSNIYRGTGRLYEAKLLQSQWMSHKEQSTRTEAMARLVEAACFDVNPAALARALTLVGQRIWKETSSDEWSEFNPADYIVSSIPICTHRFWGILDRTTSEVGPFVTEDSLQKLADSVVGLFDAMLKYGEGKFMRLQDVSHLVHQLNLLARNVSNPLVVSALQSTVTQILTRIVPAVVLSKSATSSVSCRWAKFKESECPVYTAQYGVMAELERNMPVVKAQRLFKRSMAKADGTVEDKLAVDLGYKSTQNLWTTPISIIREADRTVLTPKSLVPSGYLHTYIKTILDVIAKYMRSETSSDFDVSRSIARTFLLPLFEEQATQEHVLASVHSTSMQDMNTYPIVRIGYMSYRCDSDSTRLHTVTEAPEHHFVHDLMTNCENPLFRQFHTVLGTYAESTHNGLLTRLDLHASLKADVTQFHPESRMLGTNRP